MKSFFYYILFVLLISSCAQSKSIPITEFSQNDTNKGILVDVRTPEEFRAGHIDKALNVNWYDSDFANQFAEIEKHNTIFLYCKKGGRSAKAASFLDSLGYENVINLEGGYDAWVKQEILLRIK